MSFFSRSGGGQKVYVAPFTTESRSKLWEIGSGDVPSIPIQTIPGMTDEEKKSIELLNKYMSGGLPTGYQTALDELQKTVSGGYEPTKTTEWQGYKEKSKLEEEEAIDALRRRLQLSGMGASTPAITQEGSVRRGYSADRMQYLGELESNLINRERDRQLGATSSLAQFSDYASQLPLRQATAGQELGALPRTIEAAQDDAIYQALLTEVLFPYTYQADVLGKLSGSPYQLYTGGEGASTLEQIAYNMALMEGVIGGGSNLLSIFNPPSSGGTRFQQGY